MDRQLSTETVEGEIALVIDYRPGVSHALDVLQGAMGLIEALERLDNTLLSSIDTSLEPVSILNDVQHSSLKILLARALRKVPDDAINSLDWKKWVGGLLVKGKYILLQRVDADAPEINRAVVELTADYKSAPTLIGYDTPKIADIQDALDGISKARARFPRQAVQIQTEWGDVNLPDTLPAPLDVPLDPNTCTVVVNKGREFFKVKSTDMLGQAQWTVMRNGRGVRVDILHKSWLDRYQQRATPILPGDSLECIFEETITYDANQTEIERKISVIEVMRVITPPVQTTLL